MNSVASPNPSAARQFLPQVTKAVVGIIALCLGLTIGAAAQSGPLCGIAVSPLSGNAPLTVGTTGGCSDSTGAITSETLDWGDGTQDVIPSSSFAGFTLSHTYTSGGTFNIVLTAADSNGATGSSLPQPVVVTAPNQPPTCTLTTVTPTSGSAPLTVNASGTCTDPESDITSTQIDWHEGPPSSGTSGSHTYNHPGTFTVTLTATDSAGNRGSDSKTVTVQPPNQPPHCSLQVNPHAGNAPLTVNANGSCTDPDNNITSTVITWGDGASTNGATGTHTFTAAGDYNVTITATDSGGLKGSASVGVKVNKASNAPPTCGLSVAPGTGPAPLAVTATGSCTDPENDIVSVVLNWGDGNTINGASGGHTYLKVGTYTLLLTATDSGGLTGTATQKVIVGSGLNAPPQCTMTASPTSGQAPVSITVVPHCTDPENDIIATVADFGDGFYASLAPGGNATHTFTRAGSFTTAVTATDVVGGTSAPASQGITVTDVPTLFVGVGSGQVKQFDRNGNALKTLSTNQSGAITGMAFDWLDALYVTDFNADNVSKFNGSANLVGNFGSGYNCKPESIVFDNAGNAYVGETGCSHALLKFDAYGNLAAAYTVSTEVEGSDWIDLASDQCTIYYTSQGTTVFRFNACTGQQETPFAKGLTTGLAVKILPDSSVLVADKADIVHFDSGGRVIGKYTAAGESCFVSLALDPDGTTFWAVDYCTSDIVHFDIGSGNQLAKFNSGTAAQTTYGIGMRGAVPVMNAAGPLIATEQNVTVSAGQTASFDLAFTPTGAAVNQTFNFSCANLPVGASCQFTPSTAMVTSTGATIHVSITTTSASASAALEHVFGRGFLASWALFLGLLFVGDLRPKLRRGHAGKWLAVVIALALLASLVACSASSNSSRGSDSGNNSAPTASSTTPASNYAVILRATSGNTQSSTIVNLAVQ
jgi:PKD repeat protein